MCIRDRANTRYKAQKAQNLLRKKNREQLMGEAFRKLLDQSLNDSANTSALIPSTSQQNRPVPSQPFDIDTLREQGIVPPSQLPLVPTSRPLPLPPSEQEARRESDDDTPRVQNVQRDEVEPSSTQAPDYQSSSEEED